MRMRSSFNGHANARHPRWAAGVQRYVYAAIDTESGCIKIGCTKRPLFRFGDYGTIKMMAVIPGDYGLEEWYQGRLRAYRAKAYRPQSKEWFDPTPEVLLVVSEMMFIERVRKTA